MQNFSADNDWLKGFKKYQNVKKLLHSDKVLKMPIFVNLPLYIYLV